MEEYTDDKAKAHTVATTVAKLIGVPHPLRSVVVHDQEDVSKTWPVAIKTVPGTRKELLVHLEERWVWICSWGFLEFDWDDETVEFKELDPKWSQLPERAQKA
jgi:hypothetical protein